MTLSTVDADGYPDARVLILKGVAGEAFYLLPAPRTGRGGSCCKIRKPRLPFIGLS